MHVKIENLSKRLVLLRLNSGETLHLAPRKTSSEIEEVEINNNPKFQKLEALQIIAKKTVGKREESLEVPKKRKRKSRT